MTGLFCDGFNLVEGFRSDTAKGKQLFVCGGLYSFVYFCVCMVCQDEMRKAENVTSS